MKQIQWSINYWYNEISELNNTVLNVLTLDSFLTLFCKPIGLTDIYKLGKFKIGLRLVH